MPAYSTVLFDLDHTLFDFESSKRTAFATVLAEVGYDDPEEYIDLLTAIERPLWRRVEAGELTLDTLNDARFALLADEARLCADPLAMASRYLYWLGRSGGLLPGARAILESLESRCTLGLVSNGYSEVQRARLDIFDLDRYFAVVVISSEVGVAKPDPAFFEHALGPLGTSEPSERTGVLVVGDSLTSDIAGAAAAGLASCWFNPGGAELPVDAVPPAFVVSDLAEVAGLVGLGD